MWTGETDILLDLVDRLALRETHLFQELYEVLPRSNRPISTSRARRVLPKLLEAPLDA